jgi:hypothetical protein
MADNVLPEKVICGPNLMIGAGRSKPWLGRDIGMAQLKPPMIPD